MHIIIAGAANLTIDSVTQDASAYGRAIVVAVVRGPRPVRCVCYRMLFSTKTPQARSLPVKLRVGNIYCSPPIESESPWAPHGARGAAQGKPGSA